MFADNSTALDKHKQLPDLVKNVNTEIQKLATWFRANKMAVNIAKTKYIIFHSKGKKLKMEDLQILYNDNDLMQDNEEKKFALERIYNLHPDKNLRYYKLLGIYLDEKLNFDQNTSNVIAKLSRSIHCINRVKNILPQKALLSLYHALVQSHLTYCPTITACTSNSNIQKIFKMQKKAIRIVTNSHYRAHTEALFTKHNILPYPDIITQAKVQFIHSHYYNYGPDVFRDTWILNVNRDTNYNLRNSNEYAVLRPRIELIKRLPLYSFPVAWNSAGPSKYHSNYVTFKIALRNELLKTENSLIPHLIPPYPIPHPIPPHTIPHPIHQITPSHPIHPRS